MQTCQTTAVTEWNSLQTFKQFLYFVASTHLESESNFFFFFFQNSKTYYFAVELSQVSPMNPRFWNVYIVQGPVAPVMRKKLQKKDS